MDDFHLFYSSKNIPAADDIVMSQKVSFLSLTLGALHIGSIQLGYFLSSCLTLEVSPNNTSVPLLILSVVHKQILEIFLSLKMVGLRFRKMIIANIRNFLL